MRLIAKVIRISHAKFHYNRLTTVLDIQDFVTHFLGHIVVTSTATFTVTEVTRPRCF